METWLFLGLILLIAIIGKNTSLIVASVVVMLIKALPIAILIPIATGEITFHDLIRVFKNPAGWIAIGMGIAVAILSRWGVNQLSASPQVTVALVFGTIMGVVLFKGIAAGPVIASGLTYCIVTMLNLHF